MSEIKEAIVAELAETQPTFVRYTLELFGDDGRTWLSQLPMLLDDYAQRWRLKLLPPSTALSYNLVLPAVRAGGKAVVLKAGFPRPELIREIDALRLYDGRGMARLLEADRQQGVMLLERLLPGEMLFDLPDDEATGIAAEIMQQLWRPLPAVHNFTPVQVWASGLANLRPTFGGGTGPFPTRLVEMAESLFAQLFAAAANPVLLHGDLHHYNILSAERQPWLAIDPKGVSGEPAYEVGAWLRNPLDLMQRSQPGQLLARRIAIFSEILNVDRQRIIGWSIAQAVLSAWWSYEDHGHGWENALACAELLVQQM